VQAVANDPEAALDHAGIKVKPLDLKQMPHLFKFFPYAWYDDFFSSILWVSDVAPREHDATCLALTVRLRAGKHNSDLFKCGYVFVTRNPRFVQHSRSYCLKSQIMNSSQEGPVVHQRELATVAWLRTGLGAAAPCFRTRLQRNPNLARRWISLERPLQRWRRDGTGSALQGKCCHTRNGQFHSILGSFFVMLLKPLTRRF
jgi:hypothetical protein